MLDDGLSVVLDKSLSFFDQFDLATGAGKDCLCKPLTGMNIPTCLATMLYRIAILDRLNIDSSYWREVLAFQEGTHIGTARITNNPYLIRLFQSREWPSSFGALLRNRFLLKLNMNVAEYINATAQMLVEVAAA